MLKKLICAFALMFPLGAQAATCDVFKLDATSTLPTAVSDFSLTFEDSDGDMLFSLNELLTFSGVDFIFAGAFHDNLILAPVIGGISDGTNTSWYFDGGGSAGTEGSGSSEVWTYNLTAVSAVPLPTSSLLLLGGLGGLMVVRRRKTRSLGAA